MSVLSYFGIEEEKPWYEKFTDWFRPSFYTETVTHWIILIIAGILIFAWLALPLLKKVKIG